MKRLLGAVLATALIIPSAVLAAPPVASGTISIAPVSDLVYGGVVDFDVTYDGSVKKNDYPRVGVTCYQDGVAVWGNASMPGESVTLGSGGSAWDGGAADCVVGLYRFDMRGKYETITLLDSVAFSVGA